VEAVACPEGGDGAEILDRLTDLAATLPAAGPEPEVLARHDDTVVVAYGDVVLKTHRDGLDPALVARRAAVAARLPELLTPLALPGAGLPPYVVVLDGRAVTAWPRGATVDRTEPDAAPWHEAGTLLARLHRHPVGAAAGLVAGGRERVVRALTALRAPGGPVERGEPDALAVEAAAATLEPWTYAAAPWPLEHHEPCVVHGDVHLGQLVTPPDGSDALGGLVLLDVDDVGVGVPAWDLARPAAWFLCGLVDGSDWSAFLDGYAGAGGPLLASGRDLWAELEPAARALTVQTAARVVVAAAGGPLDTPAQWLVDACRSIAGGSMLPATP
jgi:hypothetical protein